MPDSGRQPVESVAACGDPEQPKDPQMAFGCDGDVDFGVMHRLVFVCQRGPRGEIDRTITGLRGDSAISRVT